MLDEDIELVERDMNISDLWASHRAAWKRIKTALAEAQKPSPNMGGCMVAAKTFREWYAFFGGEEMAVSRDDAAVVWEAATKAAEARFTSHNTACAKCSHATMELNGDSKKQLWCNKFKWWC